MDSYNENLHKNAAPKLYEYAKDLRTSETKAEKILWQLLKNRKVEGLKFRRQHPLDRYIADFYCHEKKLVVELDGSIHSEKEIKQYDEDRTYQLKDLNITVIRFKNNEVINNIDLVINQILEITKKL